MPYQIREYLAGRLIAEYRAEAPTSYRAVEMATGRVVTPHQSGNYFLEVTDGISGRVSVYEYADLPY
ncbi:hypothetical protein ASD99_24580 [Mesorhizobium sp. Root695]|nr:hypothetical protein ASD99_24580 [Mesorhizobium sp. Root695]